VRDITRLQPAAIVFMIVGPHSGFTLDEILKMKQAEEGRLGLFYWGYAGSLCHPGRLQEFAARAKARTKLPPKVVMAATKSKYESKTVGTITRWSIDGDKYQPIPNGVTLIGCTIAVTCRNLEQSDAVLDLNEYFVANGTRKGILLGQYIRYQVNKACGFRSEAKAEAPSRLVDIVAVADLVDPFCVHLAE